MTPEPANTRSTRRFEPAVLVLEDGSRFTGQAYGARGTTVGEVVFATGMTGYQETLTDPSYAGQIVLMTAPHIGNTGVNREDMESDRIWTEGFIVRDPSRMVSNFRAEGSLDDELENGGVVGISGVDTRAITRRIRSTGSLRGGIFSGAAAGLDAQEQLRQVMDATPMAGRNLSAEVSTPEPYRVEHPGVNVISAAIEAGKTRLRPVLMTAAAMIIGMIPMAMGLGEAGEQNAPLGRAVIGGLVLATVSTLFVVPVVYTLMRRRMPTLHALDDR
ncbi:MAG TPA: efflux RND transporter permease subunit, partial [Microbacteriaceae bacterium]|nr:efflux RND transporter permease subunit [Microbacteriaceae bacterium]